MKYLSGGAQRSAMVASARLLADRELAQDVAHLAGVDVVALETREGLELELAAVGAGHRGVLTMVTGASARPSAISGSVARLHDVGDGRVCDDLAAGRPAVAGCSLNGLKPPARPSVSCRPSAGAAVAAGSPPVEAAERRPHRRCSPATRGDGRDQQQCDERRRQSQPSSASALPERLERLVELLERRRAVELLAVDEEGRRRR